jgi:hypothetical protein
VPVHLPELVGYAVQQQCPGVALEPHHDVVPAVDQGGRGRPVGAAQAAGAVARDRPRRARVAGDADRGLQLAPVAGRPVRPEQPPPVRPIVRAAPVRELRLVVCSIEFTIAWIKRTDRSALKHNHSTLHTGRSPTSFLRQRMADGAEGKKQEEGDDGHEEGGGDGRRPVAAPGHARVCQTTGTIEFSLLSSSPLPSRAMAI